MRLEELLHKHFNEKELLEMFRDIIEAEPLKIRILKRAKCKKCGWCCKNQSAMLTIEDVNRLKTYFKCTYEQLYEKYLDKSTKIPYLKSPCPFLDNENKCNIYNVRPKVCKIYPFTDFFMVVKPCLLGEEILDKMIKNGNFGHNNGQNGDSRLQKLYTDRLELLDSITGMEPSRGVEYGSIFIDKNILSKIIKILKNKN